MFSRVQRPRSASHGPGASPPRHAPVIQRVGDEQVTAVPPDAKSTGALLEKRAIQIAEKMAMLDEDVRAGEPVDDVQPRLDVLLIQMRGVETQLRLLLEPLRRGGADPAELRQLTGSTFEIGRTVADEAGRIADAAAVPPVPKELHHFWAGGKLTKVAMTNLLAWNERARGNGWSQTLWTDPRANEKIGDPELGKQLAFLEKAGVSIGKVGEALMDEQSTAAYAHLLGELGPKNKGVLPWMSDLARYTVLSRRGGVYADVDIHPGKSDLSSPLRQTDPQGEIPFTGPGFRTVEDAQKAGYFDDRNAAIDKMFSDQAYGNHFLATLPGTKLMARVSGYAAENILKQGVTSGPSDLMKGINTAGGSYDANVRKSIPPPRWLYRTNWVTDESSAIVN
jgi:Glycosyltransferase sugar-binding region containing DXD motif